MKINEPFGINARPLAPPQVGNSTPSSRAEVLVELKFEFEDFVARIRQQLQLVSDSLLLLDQASSQLADSGAQDDVANPVSNETSDESLSSTLDSQIELSVTESPLHSGSGNKSQGEALDLWTAGFSTRAEEGTDSEAASNNASFPASGASSHLSPSPRAVAEASEPKGPAPIHTSIDPDSDPFERLNAIKARLARQIEKS